MNVVIVIKSKLPVTTYGGTQRVMWCLGKELAAMGHRVTFMAEKGSACDFARVVEMDPRKDLALQIPSDTDVIHFNNNLLGYDSCEGRRIPYIVTYHGNFISGKLDKNAVFVSRNHARRYGSESFVYNGLDWDEYGPVDLNKTRSYYHFLGKAAWRIKNVQGAIDVVRSLSQEELYVLGGYRLNFKMGFRLTLDPHIHFKGMVDDTIKKEVIQRSKGLVFPVKWDEPFGLAVTESLYLGSPVFATPYGSLPELVTPEVGFLTNSRATMVTHLLQGPSYSPQRCHEYAADLFNSRVMAEKYLHLYEQVMNGCTLNDKAPENIVPDKRKEWIS